MGSDSTVVSPVIAGLETVWSEGVDTGVATEVSSCGSAEASRVSVPAGSRPSWSSAYANPGVINVATATRAVAITHSRKVRLLTAAFL